MFGWTLARRRARRAGGADRGARRPPGSARSRWRWPPRPTLTDAGLEPRRTRAARLRGGPRRLAYEVMPGGLTRVVRRAGRRGSSRARPGRWPRTRGCWPPSPRRPTGLWLDGRPDVAAIEPGGRCRPAAAENLFWLGRYAERAEDAVRLLRVVLDRRNEFAARHQPGRRAVPAGAAGGPDRTSRRPSPASSATAATPRLADPGRRAALAASSTTDRPGTLAHAVRAPPRRRRRACATSCRSTPGSSSAGPRPRARSTAPTLGASPATRGPRCSAGLLRSGRPGRREHGARPRLAVHGRRPAHRAGAPARSRCCARRTVTVAHDTGDRQPAARVGADRGGEHHHLPPPLPVARPSSRRCSTCCSLDADNPRSLAHQLDRLPTTSAPCRRRPACPAVAEAERTPSRPRRPLAAGRHRRPGRVATPLAGPFLQPDHRRALARRSPTPGRGRLRRAARRSASTLTPPDLGRGARLSERRDDAIA